MFIDYGHKSFITLGPGSSGSALKKISFNGAARVYGIQSFDKVIRLLRHDTYYNDIQHNDTS
jgi:hypothetical protein